MKSILLSFATLISFAVTAQTDADTYDSAVPQHYFDFSLKLVTETGGFTPPVAARAFGFMGLALYEAVAPGMNGYGSMRNVLYEFNEVTLPEPGAVYHWPTVANNALSTIIDSLFRTAGAANKDSLIKIRDHYNDLFAYQLSADVFNDSKAFGEAIARDVFDYSRTDGGHNAFAQNFPPSYVPPVGPDLWVPLGQQVAMQPYWGTHRPFIEADTIEAISPSPPPFSTEPQTEFHNYALEVYDTGITLTQEETEIALFWADGPGTFTPPGHSISILTDVLQNEDASLETATIAYAKLGIAVSDAFLACWKSKYIYNLCRPVTYIQQYIDSLWQTLIGTPPFPEYPSGHSSQSGAMMTVMTDVFGDNYAFTDYSHGDNFGGPRHFSSFEEAAVEAATSRLYGGIHFGFGNQAGLNLGIIVGENVNELFEELQTSTQHPSSPLSDIRIYPNPAQELVALTRERNEANAYQLLDAYGRVMQNGELTDHVTWVNISTLAPGIYFFKVAEAMHKVVKN